MLTKDIMIPTDGRPIEAFAMFGDEKPKKALLILPGKDYTVNHFLLDFIWHMAAEKGFYSLKAEYRRFTYRHLMEPTEIEDAVEDAVKDVVHVFRFLEEGGYRHENVAVCAKSLGTMALAGALSEKDIQIDKAILLTPVLYLKKESGVLALWEDYKKRVSRSLIVFGRVDPYCDTDTARSEFPESPLIFYPGADHGLSLADDYRKTIDIQRDVINKAEDFLD